MDAVIEAAAKREARGEIDGDDSAKKKDKKNEDATTKKGFNRIVSF